MLSRFCLFLTFAVVLLFGCSEPPEPPPAQEEKVSFFEVDEFWADSLLATMSLEDKINQLILLETSQLDSISQAQLYGGVILESNVDTLLKVSELNASLEVPFFFGSPSTRFAGLTGSDLQPINFYCTSESTLDSLLSIERELNQMIGINFYYSQTYNDDSLFDPLRDYEKRHFSVAQRRLGTNFDDSVVHVVGNWYFPINDTTPVLDPKQLTENEFVKHLVDSGMLAIATDTNSWQNRSEQNLFRMSLKNQLKFEGLIVSTPVSLTDSNGLRGAFDLGADLIHIRGRDSLGMKTFKNGLAEDVANNSLNVTEIDNRVRKILLAKTWMKKKRDSSSIEDYDQRFGVRLKGMKRQIIKESIALVKNDKNRVPISDLLAAKPCLLKYGRARYKVLFDHLNIYEEVVASRAAKGTLNPNSYNRYGKVILAMHETLDSNSSKDLLAMKRLDEQGKLIVINLDHPENLEFLQELSTVIQVFGTTRGTEQKVAEAVYGGIELSGVLPKQIGPFLAGHSITTSKTRLEYSIPEEAGIHSDSLKKIRSIARNMVFSHTSPGCQVMAIKNGKVIYHQSFGHHTYDKIHPVTNNDVYDLASVTKITATTPAFMRYYEDTIFKLDDSLNVHLPDSLFEALGYRRSSFHNITFREMLLHRSGAPAGLKILPYIQYQNDSIGKWDACFCDEKYDCYDVALADGFYLDHDHLDSLWLLMNKTWLDPGKPYKYSDINMNMLYMLMKSKLQNQTFARYVDSTFYEPLGLKTLGYKPLENLDTLMHRIAPTEYDTYWRGKVLKGYVHDPTAALFGGEAGSAGLFGNVHDLGIFYQMLLNGGTYGGKRYLKQSTVNLFTGHQNVGFRGLGFNKPTGQKSSTKSIDCPTTGYGHTGFTGICVWVDPDNELIFIFASNRVHPSPTNNKINQKAIRARMHQVLYNQILGHRSLRDSSLVQ